MKKLIFASAFVGCAVASQAIVAFTDDFESGFAKWNLIGATDVSSIVTDPVNASNHVAKMASGSANGFGRSANFTPIVGNEPITIEFDMMLGGTSANMRHYLTVTDYTGDAYGSGTLTNLFAIGAYNGATNKIDANGGITTSSATTKWQARAAFGGYANSGWFVLDQAANRTTDWTHFKIEISASTVQFYVNGVAGLATALNRGTLNSLDSVAISSRLTSAGIDGYFDNIKVADAKPVPEPMTLIAIGAGLSTLALRRKRSGK